MAISTPGSGTILCNAVRSTWLLLTLMTRTVNLYNWTYNITYIGQLPEEAQEAWKSLQELQRKQQIFKIYCRRLTPCANFIGAPHSRLQKDATKRKGLLNANTPTCTLCTTKSNNWSSVEWDKLAIKFLFFLIQHAPDYPCLDYEVSSF